MNRIIAGLLAVVCLSASSAEACTRCGLFGRRCRFASVAVVDHHAAIAVAPIVATPVIASTPQVLTIQNNYTAPNGAAALIAPQGNTVYGLQAAAQPYTLDPAAVLRQAAELTKGAQQLASQGLTGYNSTASLALQLNAPANETLAKGIAASATLQAAGLSAPSQTTSQSLRITRGADGQYSVEEISERPPTAPIAPQVWQAQYSGQAVVQQQTAPQQQIAPQQQGGYPYVTQFCGKCHGGDNGSPKAGLYLAAGFPLDRAMAEKAKNKVLAKKMPPSSTLDQQTQSNIIRELWAMAGIASSVDSAAGAHACESSNGWRQQQPQRVERPAPQPSGFPLLTQHCAKCHGANQSSPKGGVYISAGSALDRELWRTARALVKGGKMPPGAKLDCETQLGLVEELSELLANDKGEE